MGEDVDAAGGASDGGKLPRHLNHIGWNDRARYLAETHSLPDADDLEVLLEKLDGIAIRYQGLPAGRAATHQRAKVVAAARKIKQEAAKTVESVDAMRSALAEFASAVSVYGENGVSWSAGMLHQVFDIPSVEPTAMDLPPELRALRAMTLSERQWARGMTLVRELAKLPIRESPRRGPVPDFALKPAVLACSEFWKRLGREWTRTDLAERTFRDTDAGARPEDLRGAAEKFVVDALTAAEIEFTLPRLNSAWVEVDADQRERRSQR